MKLAIAYPVLPPKIDGIGDYTANMAREFARLGCDVAIYTAQDESLPIEGVREIRQAFSAIETKSVNGLMRALSESRPDWFLLQYNPFAYGHRGFNPHLPLAIRELKRTLPSTRFALIAHETYVPPINPPFLAMRVWQVPQFRALAKAADFVGISTETWVREWAEKVRPTPVFHFSVGSNVPNAHVSRSEARAALNIPADAFVIGAFGTSHISRMFHLIGDVADRICALERQKPQPRPVVLLDLGPHAEPIIPTTQPLQKIAGGPHSADAIADAFAAMDIYLAPFVDGVSTRRTTLMTGLQQGVATVGTLGKNTDTILREHGNTAMRLAPIDQPERFTAIALDLYQDVEQRRKVAAQGTALYREQFGWNRAAERMLHELRVCGTGKEG